jgi:hypothetical protein
MESFQYYITVNARHNQVNLEQAILDLHQCLKRAGYQAELLALPPPEDELASPRPVAIILVTAMTFGETLGKLHEIDLPDWLKEQVHIELSEFEPKKKHKKSDVHEGKRDD